MATPIHKAVIISELLAIFLIAALLIAPPGVYADSPINAGRISEIQNPQAMIIAQNEPQQPQEQEDRSAENENQDTQNQKAETQPEKDFVPSRKIDADFAISFPYDI